MTDRPIPPRLLADHDRLAANLVSLERCVAAPHPGSFAPLAAVRWQFTRDMMLHFAHVQGQVLDPMMADRRVGAAIRAARSSEDLISVTEQFQRHADRWKGLPSPEDWNDYRRAIALLCRRLRVRLAAQETEIYPLLPVQPGGERLSPMREPLPYATLAWQVRRLIYGPDAEEQPHAA